MPANSRWDLIQRLKGLRPFVHSDFINLKIMKGLDKVIYSDKNNIYK